MGSSAGEFVSDPGPEFDPKHAPDAPAPEQDLEQTFEEWTEEQIRGALTLQGNVTHALLKVSEEDTDTWKQTEDDLAAIAPPLTRILNRYDVTRAAAAAGDEILLGTALIGYGAKNYTRRRLLLARRNAQEPEPVTGTPAPPESGPEHDPDWQRVRPDPPAIVPKGTRR